MYKLQQILHRIHTTTEPSSLYIKVKINYQKIEDFINQNSFQNTLRKTLK